MEDRYLNTGKHPINPSSEAMTETSSRQWDFITQENMTAKEAVAFLINGMKLRTFRENLLTFYSGNDLDNRLVKGMYQCALLYDAYPERIRQDYIRRKVFNWLNDKNYPVNREELFQICFVLELDEIQGDHLLKRLSDHGIHYRDGREMIYAYCLKHHPGYENALKLISEFEKRTSGTGNTQDPMTHILKLKLDGIQTEEELISFMLNHSHNLGNTSNTAYDYFCKMLSLLSEKNNPNDKSVSLESIADDYLRMSMPITKKTACYNTIQKIIKKYWPGPRTIKAMKNRSEEVSRKVLLLLYIVTGGIHGNQYTELDEDYIDSADFLETHCRQMNHMLTDCGMHKIDPRNAFDYLILFSLRPENDSFMSDRMAEIVQEIFNQNDSE